MTGRALFQLRNNVLSVWLTSAFSSNGPYLLPLLPGPSGLVGSKWVDFFIRLSSVVQPLSYCS